MEKEQEYKIGANAYEFVQKHRSYLSHAKQAELQAMLKDFAIEQVKNSVVLADVIACVHPIDEVVSGDDGDFCCKCQKYLQSHRL